ncbi:hypothetical protein [Streptomyces sp. 6N223]|uniref:hypothetical protein n=1 Tax=Streptomyces sp. 6N223 TaxID=3457412 RepID=UPI003FD5FE89
MFASARRSRPRPIVSSCGGTSVSPRLTPPAGTGVSGHSLGGMTTHGLLTVLD